MSGGVSTRRASLAAVLLLVFLTGCSTDSVAVGVGGSSLVTLDLQGLKPLGGNLNYQAWLVSQNGTTLIGTPVVVFNVNDLGLMVDPVADTLISGPWLANAGVEAVLGVAISLEMSSQLVVYSSNTFILSGEVAQGSATLTTGDAVALNTSFSNTSGRYALLTPTDQDPENELSGLWFMDTATDPAGPGLDIPSAPVGWIYEGWVEAGGQPISTGKFGDPTLADSSSAYSGTLAGPSFPGEDFLTDAPQGFQFPLDLAGADVYVTLEPWMEFDNDPAEPFFLKELAGQVPADPVPSTLYDLLSLADQLPSGTATIQDAS